jgi:addiction module RelB/DinJ family antitoxin
MSIITIEIDDELEVAAAKTLKSLDISISEAVQLFLKSIADRKLLPICFGSPDGRRIIKEHSLQVRAIKA